MWQSREGHGGRERGSRGHPFGRVTRLGGGAWRAVDDSHDPADKRGTVSRALLASCLPALFTVVACATPNPVTPAPPPPPAPTASAPVPAPALTAPPPPVEAASGYDRPPQNILEVLHAPSPPNAYVSPTHDAMLLVSWQDYPSMARVATPFLRLAGVRVEPGNHSRHDTPGGYGITPCATDYVLARVAGGRGGARRPPAGACPGRPAWTADGKRFAFVNIAADSVELWLGRRGERRGPPRGGRAPQPHARLHRAVDARPEDAPREAGPRRPRRAAARARRAPGPEHPGDRRPEGREQHLRDARHAHETSTTRTSSTTTPRHSSRWSTRRRARSRRSGRQALYDEVDAAPDGEHVLVDVDPQAVLVRHDVRPLPARGRDLEPRGRRRASRRVAAARRPRARPRRPHRPARLLVARRPSRRRWSGQRRSTAATGT